MLPVNIVALAGSDTFGSIVILPGTKPAVITNRRAQTRIKNRPQFPPTGRQGMDTEGVQRA